MFDLTTIGTRRFAFAAAIALTMISSPGRAASPQELDRARALVRRAEAERIAVIERVTPAVVCVYDKGERGGGSGMIIDPEGYGLTNFHVVAGMLGDRRGRAGLSDGWIYDLEVLGIDPTGDVAMFRLLDREIFPYAVLGDSSAVRVGDAALVLGNPFVLSEDQSPSASYGIVTGVQRYQAGVKGNLAYTDCLQVDAPVNPGNSGGPLFNAAGEIIGINGRISVNTRGRFNVGFGYAIASNQIKRFIPTMRAGLLARHGTLNISVEDVDGVGVVINDVRAGGAAERAGVADGDLLLSFDGEPIATRNRYASVLGTYPEDWPVFVEIERAGRRQKYFARLDPIEPNLHHPFESVREVNLRQVRRVLERYRRSVAKGSTAELQWPRQWVVRRDDLRSRGAEGPERYVASVGRLQREYADGRRGALIEFDGQSALRLPADKGEPVPLPTEDQMILSAQYLLWEMTQASFADEIPDRARHAGGDALVRPPHQRDHGGPYADRGPLLEVIEWPVAEQGVARFAFDAETGRIERIVVADQVTDFEATLYLGDRRDIGELSWPCGVEVYVRDKSYHDSLADWSLR